MLIYLPSCHIIHVKTLRSAGAVEADVELSACRVRIYLHILAVIYLPHARGAVVAGYRYKQAVFRYTTATICYGHSPFQVAGAIHSITSSAAWGPKISIWRRATTYNGPNGVGAATGAAGGCAEARQHNDTIYIYCKRSWLLDGYRAGNSMTEHGKISSEGNYEGNKQVGEWKKYRADPKKLWYTEQFEDGEIRQLTSYYEDGKVKRKEHHSGSKITGTCYDEKGTEIVFTPFETQPKPPYSLNEYLGNNLHYPNDAIESGIEGRVIVKFVVNEDGSISKVEVVKSVNPSCDKEAARVVTTLPKWNPGIQDDRFVSVYFTLPISFKLE